MLDSNGVAVITTTQLIQKSLNSGSAQVQILVAACSRIAIVRSYDNGSDWKQGLAAFVGQRSLYKKLSFPLSISSVNITKSV